jgi:hypothetical protein
MDDFQNITLKTFRGGIAPDGDKGPRGSFKYGQGLNIHGGRDTLKANQKLKKDNGELTIHGLPLKILPTSDGQVYAFTETGRVYRKRAGTWTLVHNENQRISGAIEYESSSGTKLLFATEAKLRFISLAKAGTESTWSGIVDVGEFLSQTESFSATLTAETNSIWIYGILNPSGDVKPDIIAQIRVEQAASQTTTTFDIVVPEGDGDRVALVVAGDYSTSSNNVSGITFDGGAMQFLMSGGGGSNVPMNTSQYAILNPGVGTKTVVVTHSAARTKRYAYAIIIDKAAQTSVFSPVTGLGNAVNTSSVVDYSFVYSEKTTATVLKTARNQRRYAILNVNAASSIDFPPTMTQLIAVNTADGKPERLFYHNENNDHFHIMYPVQGMIAITDGPQMALFDYEDAFNDQAMLMPPGLIANTLKGITADGIAILAIGSNQVGKNEGWMVGWSAQGDSWDALKPVKGGSVNILGFMEAGILVQSGNGGELKYWNFGEVTPFKVIPGVQGGFPGGEAEYRGLQMFAMNGGTKPGVYSIGRVDNNNPIAMNLEYIPSHDQMTNCEIGALASNGDDLYVGWGRTYTSGESTVTEYGIDITDSSNKAVAIYESLELDMDRSDLEKLIKHIKLVTEPIVGEGKVVVKWKSTRSQADWTLAEMGDTSDAMEGTGATKKIFDIEAQGENYEIRVEITPDGNNSPEVRAIVSMFNWMEV